MNMAVTLLDSIQDKYGDEGETGQDYGWIVFVSNSPECKKGMFPPIMTLSDYDINTIGKYTYLNKTYLGDSFIFEEQSDFFLHIVSTNTGKKIGHTHTTSFYFYL